MPTLPKENIKKNNIRFKHRTINHSILVFIRCHLSLYAAILHEYEWKKSNRAYFPTFCQDTRTLAQNVWLHFFIEKSTTTTTTIEHMVHIENVFLFLFSDNVHCKANWRRTLRINQMWQKRRATCCNFKRSQTYQRLHNSSPNKIWYTLFLFKNLLRWLLRPKSSLYSFR